MAIAGYFVQEVDEPLAFYQEALGFTLRLHEPGSPFAWIEKGDQHLYISGPGTSAHKPMLDGSVPEPGGWNRIVVEVEDIEAVVADLRARGTHFRNEPLTGIGGTQVVIEDPSGNPIEIIQRRSDSG